MFINDLELEINSKLKFVNDLFREVKTKLDYGGLQKNLSNWVQGQPNGKCCAKCKVMHIGAQNPSLTRMLIRSDLSVINQENNFGGVMDS